MYNFALAFVICAVVYLIGEAVSNLTKAWVPSVFVSAVILLVGYWTIIPKTLVSDAMLIPFGSTIGIYLLIAHLGTVISFKQLLDQWKTIVICLAGLAGMCALALLVLPHFIGREFVVAGLPPLAGGIVAATTMMDAANAAGLHKAAILAVTTYCVQGFAGYPITAVCLQVEGRRLLKDFRSGDLRLESPASGETNEGNGQPVDQKSAPRKKLLPPLPAKWNTTVMMLMKLGLVSWLATMLGNMVIPVIQIKISGAIWAMVLGILLTAIGFLEEDQLTKANSFGILMFALMMYIFDGLHDCTPQMLLEIIGPMILLIVVGVLGMAVASFVAAKVLKVSFPLAFASALTALYGFPPNAIITESVCNALSKTPEEKEFLMSHTFPPMIVGGFTTVTITSVLLAGVFASMF